MRSYDWKEYVEYMMKQVPNWAPLVCCICGGSNYNPQINDPSDFCLYDLQI